jgi:hypothetical protein
MRDEANESIEVDQEDRDELRGHHGIGAIFEYRSLVDRGKEYLLPVVKLGPDD